MRRGQSLILWFGILMAVGVFVFPEGLEAQIIIEDCGNGELDGPEEQCDPPGPCCSETCTYKSSGTVCRAAVGGCDVAEVCSGSSEVCPSDVLKVSGYLCDAWSGTRCSGSSGVCGCGSDCLPGGKSYFGAVCP